MESKVCLKFLLLFLGFSYLLSSTAVSATRNLKSSNEIPSSVQEILAQDGIIPEVSDSEEVFGRSENDREGRMVLENTDDYPGTGANNNHDPKTPSRV